MSRYILTQEQLDQLQQQIQELTKLNDTKQERIKELELHKARVSDTITADLIKTIGKLENEIVHLKRANERLRADVNLGKAKEMKISELEMLLEEEQKLRKYSETFAKHIELKCAEESLIRELTTELCQLQKAEIEIDNKHIQELQSKLKNLNQEEEDRVFWVNFEKEKKQNMNVWSRENFLKNSQLKFITEQLKAQLSALRYDVDNNPAKTREDHQQETEIDKWLKESYKLVTDINDIENLKKDLKYIRNEIENRKKSLQSKYN